MDLGSGYPFWLIKNGLPFNYPFLEKNLKVDVLVIGGGISGALMLYHLNKAGVNCVLIEKRTIGLGSSCASTSLLQYEIDVPLTELTKKIGKTQAFTAYNLCSEAIDKLELISQKIDFKEFERKQSLYFAAYKKDVSFLKKEFELRKEAGFDIKYLDSKTIMKRFGFYASAALLSCQGAQTNAYNFTHTLLQYCINNGSSVYDRTTAVSIGHQKQKITASTDKGFKITANKLVYATGYEVLDTIDKKILDLKSTYAVCSEQMNKKQLKLLEKYLVWNTAEPYLYLRLTPDNRILIGGRDEDYYNPSKRDKLLPQKTKQLVWDFKRLFPDIPFQPEFSWTGTFGATKDGLPFIGTYQKQDNVFFSLGFGGNGITFSLIGAEMITDMITKNTASHKHLFSFNRI